MVLNHLRDNKKNPASASEDDKSDTSNLNQSGPLEGSSQSLEDPVSSSESNSSKTHSTLEDTPEQNLEQAKRTLQASKRLAARFGEIVALLMRTPNYKHYSLADMEWMVVPPLLNNQLIMVEARAEEKGLAIPVGLALWASVADDVDARLSNNLNRPVRLHPSEWKSGDHLWLIDVIGPPQIAQGLINQLGTTVFEGKSFKVRNRDKDGKHTVKTIEPGKDQNTEDDNAQASAS